MSWEVEHHDDQPSIPLDIGGVQMAGTRENLWLYTFAPEYKDIDHAYLLMEQKKKKVGYYMFRLAVPDFDQLAQLMDENYYWHVRGFKPSDPDIKAYTGFEAERDERPEWLN